MDDTSIVRLSTPDERYMAELNEWAERCRVLTARGIDADLQAAYEENAGSFPFGIEEVATVLLLQEGERDGEEWTWRVTLNDGRVFLVVGWCDYTGWDCRSGVTVTPE